MLFVLRDQPDARDDHAAQFKRLIGALGGRGVDFRASEHGLRIFGTPVADAAPLAGALRTHLLDRGIGELRLAGTASAAQLLEVTRALARPPSFYRSLHDLATSLTPVTREILVLAPPAADELKSSGDWDQYGGTPAVLATGRSSQRVRVDALPGWLEAIERAPERGVERLNDVVRAVDDLAAEKEWRRLLDAIARIVKAERELQGSPLARTYAIAIRRMMPRSVVEQVARLTSDTALRDDAQLVLRRVGADATEALLALLASADRMEDRRAYFGALRLMTEGTDLLVNMLTHNEWYVVRNVADLCGELRLEAAIPRLSRHARHEDERVRRSVAAALARIGTPSTLEALRSLLRDPSAAVRLSLAQQVDARLRGLAMSLAVALDDESQPEIVRELLLALGRIGTSEAVKALARAAEPGGRLLNRKPSAARVAAVEALALSGSAQAEVALRTLLDDRDARVRAAAEQALGNPPQTMVG